MHEWNSLEHINLARNMLSSIDALEMYPNLISINANNNYVRFVSLTMKKLRVLDLENNFIQTFPNLDGCPELRSLNMNSN